MAGISNLLSRHRIANLFQTLAYDPDHYLFYQADQSLAFGFHCQPLPGVDGQFEQRMNALLTSEWPDNTLLQFCLWASPDIERILRSSEWRTRVSAENREISGVIKQLHDFLREKTKSPLESGMGTVIRNIQLVVVAILPVASGQPRLEEIERAKSLRALMEQALVNLQVHPVPIDASSYLRLMDTLINWGGQSWRDFSTSPYDPFTPLRDQIADYDMNLSVDKEGITLGEKRVRILSAKRLPERMFSGEAIHYLGDHLSGTRGIPQNCVLTVNLYYPPQENTRFKLENKRLWMIRQASTPLVKYLPDIIEAKDELVELFERLNSGDLIVKAALGMILFTSKDQEDRHVTNARVYFREQGFQLVEDKFFCLPLFFHYLPFHASRQLVEVSTRYKTLSTGQAVPLLPVFSDWKGTGTPVMNFVSRSGQLMSVSLFDSDSNYNCTIAAQSGSGKSFLTNQMIVSYLAEGGRVWVIDVGRSYKNVCELLKGDFMEFGRESRVCLNPFDGQIHWEEDSDMLAALIEAMAAPREGLNDLQVAGLKRIMRDVFSEHGRQTTIDHIAQRLKAETDSRLKDVGEQLYPFTTQGEYGRFVNGQRNIRFEKDFIVLELEELKGRKHLQQIVLLLLIYAIQQEMYHGHRDRPKLVIIDEAWDLLTEGEVARFIEHGYRRFRKYGGSAVTITQGVDDFYRNPVGQAIVANSAHMFLLRQKEESIDRIKREGYLALSEYGYELIKSVHTIPGKYSEIFFKGPFGNGIGRLYVPDRLKLLYSTKPDEVEAIRNLREQGFGLMEAIDELIKRRKS
jgi:conjugal transfer ATP-binding protein TraC